ncbi:ubiquitin carboxyl-terminal hydrolase 33 [Neocloeon triangulifer]|uniref:ubiquitin carboxyl-terminal hydrolase 33 n=1 Tax=Neocloeon triangulifer TaxID=2078957 RepID=UPI00286F832E|nr:ubiquitin carboxyl-terminal hydrolase 33 [Neocloeon triangulifer]
MTTSHSSIEEEHEWCLSTDGVRVSCCFHLWWPATATEREVTFEEGALGRNPSAAKRRQRCRPERSSLTVTRKVQPRRRRRETMAKRIMSSRCPHVHTLADVGPEDVEAVKQRKATCKECESKGPNLWVCLHHGCLRVGCGEAHNDHSTIHNKDYPEHCLHLNLSTQRVWCYNCENEVFLEHNLPALTKFTKIPTQQTEKQQAESESSDSDASEDSTLRPRGLTGLQNIGNTCYMNSALQALSNTPPLTRFFLECGTSLVKNSLERKPNLARSYLRLMQDMWHPKRLGYVTPSNILYGIRNVHPIFRGYQQHDTQEFLRCFMDQLHEELKEPIMELENGVAVQAVQDEQGGERLTPSEEDEDEEAGEGPSSQSEGEYETCDSGVSERSSLSISDDGERKRTSSRRLSRSPSPSQDQQVRNKGAARVAMNGFNGPRAASPNKPFRRKHSLKHKSIISDIFDGKLLSSVQCLTCDRVSSRVETFQDLSLPIPSRDHLQVLHQGSQKPGTSMAACSDAYGGEQGWIGWMWEWLRSWFWGPTVSLHDCLAAFFSADELKGDNMYSCERCSKLRNGMKYSKVLELPEVLCIHLKRFRHELMFSSKIGCYVTFPLEGLDMRPYLHKDCSSEVTNYDLMSVICHIGTAGGGHYICYSCNANSQQWYEFDDHRVSEVSPHTVQSCEGYVLFYKKSSEKMNQLRQRTMELIQRARPEPSLMQFYVSKQWLSKFNTFAEPGPIDNSDLLCVHGAVHPQKVSQVRDLCAVLSQSVWEYLYDKFSGGPPCNRLFECTICKQEQESLYLRLSQELESFLNLNSHEEATSHAISMSWFRQWQAFVQRKSPDPPGPIDNLPICNSNNGVPTIRPGSDYAQLSAELWKFFHTLYGGGPELVLRQQSSSPTTPSPPSGGIAQIGMKGPQSKARRASMRARGTSEDETPSSPPSSLPTPSTPVRLCGSNSSSASDDEPPTGLLA